MSLRGSPGSAWTLTQAVDAMGGAARQAGRPGAIWLAGLTYQFLNLGWAFGATVALPVLQSALPDLDWLGLHRSGNGFVRVQSRLDLLSFVRDADPWLLLLVVPALLALFRLVAGLARLSSPRRWVAARGGLRPPGLAQAWTEGDRLTRPTLGLWLQIVVMMFVATLLFVGPAQLLVRVVHLERWNPFTSLLAGTVVALMLVYSFTLSILFQIALHSLVRNRRGVGSALLHAWRIAKNDPMATARATTVDAVLYLTVLAVHVGSFAASAALAVFAPAAFVLDVGVEAFAGCVRCAYWARAYEALGGLATVSDEPTGSAARVESPGSRAG